ncbi:MAG: hypothetical protein DWH91_18375 [Planctomycetota bacterium]|nr:MAG: hypothetical protein DWH91_18375 [Planctomycetota bacterium]
MDKLQPILKHQFWILLVPLLSLTIWGYVSTNGKLRAATQTREDELKKALSSVPKGAADPNQKYIDGLKGQNDQLDKFVKDELNELWVRQLPQMVWPEIVKPGIPEKYRGTIADIQTRENYRTEYEQILENLHHSVEPFIADKTRVTWTEKVDFPRSLIPRARPWHLTPPENEIWDAQEDVWFTQLIIDAIRDMNRDADSPQSAVVRKVIKYQLLGGNGESSVGGAVAEGSEGGPSYGAPDASMMDSMSSGSSGGGRGGMARAPMIRFDPQEEFGTGGVASAAMGQGMGFSGNSSASYSPSGESGDTDSSEGAESTETLRYVKEVPEAPFVERGFYLSVIVHQSKMVDFMVRLQNSDWPIRIVRFHFGKNPYAPDTFAGPGARGGMPSSSMPDSFSSQLVPESSGVESLGSPDTGDIGLFSGGLPGIGGPSSSMGGGNANYPQAALQNADLIQLDLAGLITLYRQPVAEEAAVEGSSEAAAPVTETPVAPEGGSPAAEPAAGAAEGTPAPASPEAPTTPAGPVEGTAPAAETSAAEPVPGGEPPAPAPAATPAAEVPAAETPAP